MRASDRVRGIGVCGTRLLLIAAIAGCHAAGNAPQQPAAATQRDHHVGGETSADNSLVDTHYRFRAAIYHAHPLKRDVRAVVQRLAGEQFALVTDEDAADKLVRATV